LIKSSHKIYATTRQSITSTPQEVSLKPVHMPMLDSPGGRSLSTPMVDGVDMEVEPSPERTQPRSTVQVLMPHVGLPNLSYPMVSVTGV